MKIRVSHTITPLLNPINFITKFKFYHQVLEIGKIEIIPYLCTLNKVLIFYLMVI